MMKLENLCCGFEDKKILENINLEIPKGKITSIVGVNGCGKTTLLKTACRLINPLSGNILSNGKDVWATDEREFAKHVAVLPQSRTVPQTSVKMLVSHGRFPYMGFYRKQSQQDKKMIEYAMQITGTDKFKDRNLTSLSGGERQRAYFAMIIAQDTDIIFLDEPTTYLDINAQFEILDLVKELNKKGKTIVMVLHDLSHSLIYSDYIAVLNNAKIEKFGTSQEIYESQILEKVFNVKILKGEKREGYYFAK